MKWPAAWLVFAIGIAACGGDGSTAPTPPQFTDCNGVETSVLTLQPLQGTVVGANDIGCIAFAGYGARYLVLPQLTGTALPYGGYGYRIGNPDPASTPSLTINRDVLAPTPDKAEEGDDAQMRFDSWLRSSEAHLSATRRRDRHTDAGVQLKTSLPQPSLDISANIPAIGTLREFGVLSNLDDPAVFAHVGTRLRYAGTHVLVYIDTLAADVFTLPEINALGALYDTLYNVDKTTFGDGSDIDGNGRIIFLLTPTVNALTSASQCAISGYVRGFFYGYDLSDSASSNQGEIMYGYVPDPTGRWSCAHTKAEVQQNLPPTFIHELQHLISYGEHVIARGGVSEESWLNEGLSHLAEELGSIQYEQQLPAPAGRTDPGQLFPDLAEPFITPNLLYSNQFLFVSQQYSILSCAPGTFCSLPERGAIWLFLRWLGDQKGSNIYRQLVQTSLTGAANLEASSGEKIGALLGDFAITVVADSIDGVPRNRIASRYHFTSRNIHQLYRALYEAYGPLGGVAHPFPIDQIVLANGTFVTGTMRPKTFATYRIDVPAHVPVSVIRFSQADGTPFAASAGAQVSIFRLP